MPPRPWCRAKRSSSRETGSAAVLRQLVGRRHEGFGSTPPSFIDFLYLGTKWFWLLGDTSPAWCPYAPLEVLSVFRRPERGAPAVPPGLYPGVPQTLPI